MFTPVLFLVIISHAGERTIVFVVEKGRSIFGYWTLRISKLNLVQILLLKVLINYQ